MVHKILFYRSYLSSYSHLKRVHLIYTIYFFLRNEKKYLIKVKKVLYFLKETVNNHKWDIHSFQIQFLLTAKIIFSTDPLSVGFITLLFLTLTSFKTRDVTLKQARFLNVGIWVLVHIRKQEDPWSCKRSPDILA